MTVEIKTTARYLYTKLGRKFFCWTWEAVGLNGESIANSKDNPEEVWDDDGIGYRSEWYEDFDAYEAGRSWALSNGYIVRENDGE